MSEGRLNVLALWCRNAILNGMSTTTRRSTIYFDQMIHRALRLKAAETDRSISDLVNDAVKAALADDAEDLAAFDERVAEPNLSYEEVVKNLKRSGKI